jgi:hypothetical protein
MTHDGDLAYAWARLSARMGERPDEVAWRTIEPIRDLPALLDAARGPAFRRWLRGITPDAPPHAIEAVLLAHWRALGREVASWMPAAWQPALEWAVVLADLPVLQHLARAGEALPWMQEDPVYRELLEGAREPTAFGRLAPLAAAWSDSERILGAWREEWSRRVPWGAWVDTTLLAQLVRALGARRILLAQASLANGAALRRVLADSLTIQFRRATLNPTAAFVFLALCAVDLERLRGELLRRAIFPGFELVA